MMVEKSSGSRCFGISWDTYQVVYAVCKTFYTFLDMPLFGTLFPNDLISVELPFATSELKEEQYCYRVFGCDPALASLLE